MTEFLTISCPHCDQEFQIPFDVDEGASEFIVDCEICCRPMTVKVRVRGGDVASIEITAA